MKFQSLLGPAVSTLLAGCAPSLASEAVVPLNYLPSLAGTYFPLKSEVMASPYHVYIRYPANYSDQPTKNYPIVYLLDGDSTFPMLAPKHLFLTYDDGIPEAIIVGISYGSFASPVNRREADFGVRAADFQRFIAQELMPAVEGRVRADTSKRILVGQSFGGSFVLYSAFTRPDLFWAHIASNPSARMHTTLLAGAPASANRNDLQLVLVSGTANNPAGRAAALDWVNRWSRQPTPWKLHQIDIPGGTHAADLDNAYRLALRRLFSTNRE